MTPNDALKNLIAIAGNVADAHTTALYVLDEDGQSLKLRHHLTLSPHFNARAEIPRGEGLIGQVLSEQKAVLMDFSQGDVPKLPFYSRPEDLKGLLALPINSDGIQGVLLVDSKEQYSLTTKLQKILTGFAAQAAWHVAEERREPYWIDGEPEDFTRMIKWCRFLAESPDRKTLSERFMHIPKNLLITDALAVIWFKSDGTGKVTRARGWDASLKDLILLPGDTLCGSCEQTGEPVLIRNRKAHPDLVLFHEGETMEPFDSIMVVPIVTQKRLQGLVVAARRNAGGLTRADLDRLSLMTAFGALALDNSEIKSQWEYDKNLCQVTGIPNHRFLASHLNSIEQVVLKDENPLSVLTLNVKNLSAIYEKFGLETGDRFLEEMVTLTLEYTEDPKFIFRYSETALVVLLMEKTLEEVQQQLIILEARFQNNTFSIDGHAIKPNIQYGLASCPEDGKQLGDLIATSWSNASQPKERHNV